MILLEVATWQVRCRLRLRRYYHLLAFALAFWPILVVDTMDVWLLDEARLVCLRTTSVDAALSQLI